MAFYCELPNERICDIGWERLTCTDAYVPDADLIENQTMIPDMSRVLLRLVVKKLVPFQDKRDRTADLMTASCDRFVISGDF